MILLNWVKVFKTATDSFYEPDFLNTSHKYIILTCNGWETKASLTEIAKLNHQSS
jgi:hypothetical protein